MMSIVVVENMGIDALVDVFCWYRQCMGWLSDGGS